MTTESSRAAGRSRAAALLAVLLLPVLPAAADGIVAYVEGDVRVVSGGVRTVAEIGDPLKDGDTVTTGRDGTAVLTLEGGDEVKLRADTSLVLRSSAPGNTRMSLDRGGVFSKVSRLVGAGRWTLETPTMVAAVRGTEFFASYGRTVDEAPDVWLCVNEGTVEVAVPSTGQAVLVDEGLGVNILGGTLVTEPAAYPWTKGLNWNTDASAGPVADRTDLDGAYADLRSFDYD